MFFKPFQAWMGKDILSKILTHPWNTWGMESFFDKWGKIIHPSLTLIGHEPQLFRHQRNTTAKNGCISSNAPSKPRKGLQLTQQQVRLNCNMLFRVCSLFQLDWSWKDPKDRRGNPAFPRVMITTDSLPKISEKSQGSSMISAADRTLKPALSFRISWAPQSRSHKTKDCLFFAGLCKAMMALSDWEWSIY